MTTDNDRKYSPPLTPPTPDTIEPDQKPSRKREREVSLEPVNSPKQLEDKDRISSTNDHRDFQTPAKRNRRSLETTKEESLTGTEEDTGLGSHQSQSQSSDSNSQRSKANSRSRSRSPSASPPADAIMSVSPRQEIKIKVRQISRGVEDLSCQVEKPKVTKMGASPGADEESSIAKGSESHRDADMHEPSMLEPSAEVDEKPHPVTTAPDAKNLKDSSKISSNGTTLPDVDVKVEHAVQSSVTQNQSHIRSQSEGGEKGLKRRFEERGTSQGPQEDGNGLEKSSESLKRLRDDSGVDPNPRETKRLSPPPEQKAPPRASSPSPKVPKSSGFMAYASTSSPFASVKGQNIFSSGKNTPSSSFASQALSTPSSSLGTSSKGSSTSTPATLKRSGFEAFASPSSPFSSFARSKSPILGQTSKLGSNAKAVVMGSNSITSNPFASYANNAQGFGVPTPKRVRAGSPSDSSHSSVERGAVANTLNSKNQPQEDEEEEDEEKHETFGERLRATKDEEDAEKIDDEPKIHLTEQEVITGEEDEETLHQVRGKLFILDKENQWKEKGVGLLKLNVKRADGTGARLVMRKDAVYTLILNVTLFCGMRCHHAQDPRYVLFSAIENGNTSHYNLRVSTAKIAEDLIEAIQTNIPAA